MTLVEAMWRIRLVNERELNARTDGFKAITDRRPMRIQWRDRTRVCAVCGGWGVLGRVHQAQRCPHCRGAGLSRTAAPLVGG